MAMVKRGISFQNSIVEVLDGKDSSCEKCGSPLNMMSSTNGIVPCSKCGHKNKVKNMEKDSQPPQAKVLGLVKGSQLPNARFKAVD